MDIEYNLVINEWNVRVNEFFQSVIANILRFFFISKNQVSASHKQLHVATKFVVHLFSLRNQKTFERFLEF